MKILSLVFITCYKRTNCIVIYKHIAMSAILHESIKNVVFESIDAFNAFQDEAHQLGKALNTVLFSRAGYTREGKLDSLGLVNFLVIVDEKMIDAFGKNFSIGIQEVIDNKEVVLVDLERFINFLEKKFEQ